MPYSNWNNSCPYAALCASRFSAVHNPYGDLMLDENDFYATDPEVQDSKSLSRAQRDIERVIPIALQNAANEVNQMIALGIPPRLISYLVREMVEYIDFNYSKYDKSASYNITQASEDIKTKLNWIFNILRIYGVPFEVQKTFLNTVVITAIKNLRA